MANRSPRLPQVGEGILGLPGLLRRRHRDPARARAGTRASRIPTQRPRLRVDSFPSRMDLPGSPLARAPHAALSECSSLGGPSFRSFGIDVDRDDRTCAARPLSRLAVCAGSFRAFSPPSDLNDVRHPRGRGALTQRHALKPATTNPRCFAKPIKSTETQHAPTRPATFPAMEIRNENANLVLLVGTGQIET